MILRSYLISNVLKPFLGTLMFLTLLFSAWAASRLIGEGGAVSMTLSEFIWTTVLRTQIALEMIIPIALFLSVVSALGSMAAAQEFVALRAIGGSTRLLMVSVGFVGVLAASVIGGEAIFLRPWAYSEIYQLREQIGQDTNLDRVEAGRFYSSDYSGRVVFAAGKEDTELKDVFVQREHNGRTEFIFASEAQQVVNPDGSQALDFKEGYIYQLTRKDTEDWHINFNKMRLNLESTEEALPAQRYKTQHTLQLLGNTEPAAAAELQSRLTTPMVTLLLALLAVPLSRFAPRSGRYARLFYAVVVLVAYLNLYVIFKNWVKEGSIAIFPGLYWVPTLILVAIFVLLMAGRFHPRRRKKSY